MEGTVPVDVLGQLPCRNLHPLSENFPSSPHDLALGVEKGPGGSIDMSWAKSGKDNGDEFRGRETRRFVVLVARMALLDKSNDMLLTHFFPLLSFEIP